MQNIVTHFRSRSMHAEFSKRREFLKKKKKNMDNDSISLRDEVEYFEATMAKETLMLAVNKKSKQLPITLEKDRTSIRRTALV